jgi:transposase
MASPRPTYTDAFREQIVALHQSGRTPRELAEEFQPCEWTIRDWIRKAKAATASGNDSGPNAGSSAGSSANATELDRLRKENRRLKIERDILAKAAAWFAQETKTVPPSSNL